MTWAILALAWAETVDAAIHVLIIVFMVAMLVAAIGYLKRW